MITLAALAFQVQRHYLAEIHENTQEVLVCHDINDSLAIPALQALNKSCIVDVLSNGKTPEPFVILDDDFKAADLAGSVHDVTTNSPSDRSPNVSAGNDTLPSTILSSSRDSPTECSPNASDTTEEGNATNACCDNIVLNATNTREDKLESSLCLQQDHNVYHFKYGGVSSNGPINDASGSRVDVPTTDSTTGKAQKTLSKEARIY